MATSVREVDHSRDGESRSVEISAILSVFCVLTTVVVALRIHTRVRLLGMFGADDAFMIGAQVLAIATAVAIGLECKYGLGRHTWVQPEEHYIPYMKAFYTSIIVYNVGMCLVKISILLQYRRIFAIPTIQKITKYGVAFIGAWAIMLCFLLPMVCIPVVAFWDTSVKGRCLNNLHIWYVMAVFNLTTDLALLAIPLPVIRSLQLPVRQKFTLFFVFGLGSFTCIISMLRIRTLKNAAATDDPNWDNVEAAYWSFLEVCTAILAASLPTLRPVLAKVMPSVFGTQSLVTSEHLGDGSTPRFPGSRVTYGRGSTYGRGASGVRSGVGGSKPDSMETLNDDDVELMRSGSAKGVGKGYSVTVHGGFKGDGEGERVPTLGGIGIETTTVVTEQVAGEAGEEERGERRWKRRSMRY